MPEIVYEDNHLLIVVKPQNQLTQADNTGDLALQDELKQYIKETYQKPGEVYLGIVHRLDRPVGGLVAFAKTSKAAARLTTQLQNRTMHRDYLAVIENAKSLPDSGKLENWLYKDEKLGTVSIISANSKNAKRALLSYRVISRRSEEALVQVLLDTGRKHQIRVQFSAAGSPLKYDMRYGKGIKGENIALWGAKLSLEHPTQHNKLTFFSYPKGSAFVPFRDDIEAFFCEDPYFTHNQKGDLL